MNIQKNVNLKQFTTVKSNTVASLFATVTTRDEFIEAFKYAKEHGLQTMIIGGGSNTVFATEKIDKLVIRNQFFNFNVLSETETTADIEVSAGLPVSMLVQKTIERGFEGFEYHQGLPGSVGGALYDYSTLQKTHEVLIEAAFRLNKTDKDILKHRATEAIEYRKKTQPFGVASSGCVFQNINGQSAGELIDKAGLKGTRVGKFVVSEIHANFIINEGDDNMENLKKLIALVKETVKAKFGVELKEEVRIIE